MSLCQLLEINMSHVAIFLEVMSHVTKLQTVHDALSMLGSRAIHIYIPVLTLPSSHVFRLHK